MCTNQPSHSIQTQTLCRGINIHMRMYKSGSRAPGRSQEAVARTRRRAPASGTWRFGAAPPVRVEVPSAIQEKSPRPSVGAAADHPETPRGRT